MSASALRDRRATDMRQDQRQQRHLVEPAVAEKWGLTVTAFEQFVSCRGAAVMETHLRKRRSKIP